jgi:hypothetical protein
MPAEAIRLQRRLGARDRWFIALLAGAILIGTFATIVIGRVGTDSPAKVGSGCVALSRASWMGSATIRYCGADAVTYCRESQPGQSAAGHAESVARCRAAGILPPG